MEIQTLIFVFAIIFIFFILLIIARYTSRFIPDLDKIWEEENRRRLEQVELNGEKNRIRQSKEKNDWTIEDWNDEYEHFDSHSPSKIYWRELLIFQRDNFQCRFCGTTDEKLLHAIYNGHSGFQDINITGADRSLSWFYTVCENCRFEQITPGNFEKLVGRIFENMGYSVILSGSTGDEGVDLICTRKTDNERVIVQCKRYKGKVGAPIIRDFYGALIHSKASKGYIVTTGHFTSNASNWAKGKPIELIDREQLLKLLL